MKLKVNITLLSGKYAGLSKDECERILKQLIEGGMVDSELYAFVSIFLAAFE